MRIKTYESIHFHSLVVLFQLLIADLFDLLLFLSGQLLPDRLIYLDYTQSLGVVEHLHILKPFEWIGQDVPLGLGVGIAALGVDTVGLFHHQTAAQRAS